MDRKNFFGRSFFLLSVCFGLMLPALNQEGECKGVEFKKALPVAEKKEATNLQEFVNEMFGDKTISKKSPLYNYDDSEDYLLTEFEEGGYAIFYKESMELLEYSPSGKKIQNDTDRIYYGGPNNTYKKQGHSLKNIETDEMISFSSEFSSKASNIRSAFKGHKLSKSKSLALSETKNVANGSDPKYDGDNKIFFYSSTEYGTTWIPNHQYFVVNPLHGDNETGTCGAVAAEMLLTYHNYYNDRRIIPENYLCMDDEASPNRCYDPMKMTIGTLGARGTIEKTSDPNSYFAKIVKKIPASAAYFDVTSGLKSILKERKDALGDSFNYTVEDKYGGWFFGSLKVDTTRVKNEIKKGNPSIVLMQSNLGAMNHYVVVYGSAEYTYPGTSNTYNGFIANFGWGQNDVNIWINSSWITAYTVVTINHEHVYNGTKKALRDGRYEYKCSICNHRTDAAIQMNSGLEKTSFSVNTTFPLNYGNFSTSDPFYETKIYRYKDYYFKPTTSGKYIVQTFGSKSTTLIFLDANYNTIAYNQSGYGLSNSYYLLDADSSTHYYIRLELHPLRETGTTRLCITPTSQSYTYSWNLSLVRSNNVSTNVPLSKNTAGVFYFSPSTAGSFEIKSTDSRDTVLFAYDVNSATNSAFDDDSGLDHGRQARIVMNMSPSTSYYIVVSFYSNNNSGPLNLTITKLS